MHCQFFGNYLLERELLTHDQLIEAMNTTLDSNVISSILCVYKSLVIPSEAVMLLKESKETGTPFYQLCMDKSILSSAQIEQLKNEYMPHYLVLAQVLVDMDVVPIDVMADCIVEYEQQSELVDLEMMEDLEQKTDCILSEFATLTDSAYRDDLIDYISLLFNNLIHFIGSDFEPLPVQPMNQYYSKICSIQSILGTPNVYSMIDMQEDTAIEFANRFTDMEFETCDEYVHACLDDFLNLQNGLYIVNESNERNRTMTLDAPYNPDYELQEPQGEGFFLSTKFPFGYVNFFFSLY